MLFAEWTSEWLMNIKFTHNDVLDILQTYGMLPGAVVIMIVWLI